jgi:hypothetical protein
MVVGSNAFLSKSLARFTGSSPRIAVSRRSSHFAIQLCSMLTFISPEAVAVRIPRIDKWRILLPAASGRINFQSPVLGILVNSILLLHPLISSHTSRSLITCCRHVADWSRFHRESHTTFFMASVHDLSDRISSYPRSPLLTHIFLIATRARSSYLALNCAA